MVTEDTQRFVEYWMVLSCIVKCFSRIVKGLWLIIEYSRVLSNICGGLSNVFEYEIVLSRILKGLLNIRLFY